MVELGTAERVKLLKQLVSVTNCGLKVAKDTLEKYDWDYDRALNEIQMEEFTWL